MAKPLLDDGLWELMAPSLPPAPPKPKGGWPRIDDRAALTGIVFVLKTGIPWEDLPQELGCGSGMTCWRRVRDWHAAGVWDRIHHPPDSARPGGRAGCHRLVAGGAGLGQHSRQRGGEHTGPNPPDRGKPGTKRHVVVDAQGIPLASTLSAANVHDARVVEEVIDAIRPIKKLVGRPRRRPAKLHADKAYDFPRCRSACRTRGITPRIARRGIESSERLGRHRWVVERTLAWLARVRRLAIRYERRVDIHQAFLTLGCALICWNFLQRL
jgi:transposase